MDTTVSQNIIDRLTALEEEQQERIEESKNILTQIEKITGLFSKDIELLKRFIEPISKNFTDLNTLYNSLDVRLQILEAQQQSQPNKKPSILSRLTPKKSQFTGMVPQQKQQQNQSSLNPSVYNPNQRGGKKTKRRKRSRRERSRCKQNRRKQSRRKQ